MAERTERLLKVGEVAGWLGCSPGTVRKIAGEGLLPAVRLSEHGHLRFATEDVEALIERRREDAHAPAAT
jgi:excisionase family DNA binding protein